MEDADKGNIDDVVDDDDDADSKAEIIKKAESNVEESNLIRNQVLEHGSNTTVIPDSHDNYNSG